MFRNTKKFRRHVLDDKISLSKKSVGRCFAPVFNVLLAVVVFVFAKAFCCSPVLRHSHMVITESSTKASIEIPAPDNRGRKVLKCLFTIFR